MIILDYSGVAVSSLFAQASHMELNEDLLRHMILNSVRMYNSKFKKDYGQMYIVCDHMSWRKGVYPYYKANRKTAREESDMDWAQIFDWLSMVRQELDQYGPYNIIHVEGAEADDIVHALVERSQEFGQSEKIMIVSSDKDFLQLQKYPNVEQFSSILKKPLTEADPQRYLFEHIVRGDSGDGVPNIFSDDDTFVVEDKRQTPVTKKKLDALYEGYKSGSIQFDKIEHERNFHRNQKMIDLSKIPDDVKTKILNEIKVKETKEKVGSNAFLNYLIQKRCTKLISQLTDFF